MWCLDARTELAIHLPLLGDLTLIFPIANCESSKVSGTQGGCLGNARADHWAAKKIGLELHEEIVRTGSAIDSQFLQADAGVALHRLQNIGDLKGDAFQRSTGDVGFRGAARQTDHDAAGILIPMRCAKPGECWHEKDAAIVGHLGGEGFDFAGGIDDAESITEPLHDSTRDEDAAFKRILGFVADAPCDGREQVVLGRDGLCACVHEHEATSAVGVLHHAGLGAGLAEESGLLVASDARNGDRAAEKVRLAIDFAARADFRQDGARHAEEFQQIVVPVARVDVEKHRAGCIARVGHVRAPASEVPDQPRVDGAKGELPGLCFRLGTGHVIQDPLELRGREIRIDHEPGLLANHLLHAARFQLVAGCGRAPILPDDGVVNGLSGLAIPNDGRLPLIRDADGRDVARIQPRLL